jgi:hypothetical protein
MASKKITLENYKDVIDEMVKNTNGSRSDSHYFSQNELSPETLKQLAWEKNLLVTIENFDNPISKLTFLEILN